MRCRQSTCPLIKRELFEKRGVFLLSCLNLSKFHIFRSRRCSTLELSLFKTLQSKKESTFLFSF